ncbi:PAC2 family protein [Propionicicella superfundia]|uniref:PAC2 family protein n=1 Tax=Propionicicella superfundia TaxID=348582 RepID=UPI0004073CAF|nr:PAC2 family protein [Propionicicella superfundia]
MLDPRLLYSLDPEVWDSMRGLEPVLIHYLDGYMDAGTAGRTVAETLLAELDNEVLVDFDVDQLHDYRSRRPIATFDTNRWEGVKDYTLRLYKMTDLSGQPFLLLNGPEPDSQWNRFIEAVLQLAERLGVRMLLSGHGVPIAVPHTRPTLIHTHASDPSLATGNPAWLDRVEVPAGISAVIEYRAGLEGRTAVGYVAHVPHYLAQTSFYQASVALMRRFAERGGLDLPVHELESLVASNLASIDAELSSDNELPQLVRALEEQYEKLARVSPENLPSADEIGAAVEAYLAEQEKPQDPGDAGFR